MDLEILLLLLATLTLIIYFDSVQIFEETENYEDANPLVAPLHIQPE